jgi:phosphoribosylaminoimidazole-succinocarboxamide synthase
MSILNKTELMNFIRNQIHDDLFVELSEEWENEKTEYHNANWVKNIREAEDITELKEALIRIVKGLSKYLEETKWN